MPNKAKQNTNRQIILEASAIIAYQNRPDAIKILLADDAPQFRQITELLALCWVHDGRHYKKLVPIVPLLPTAIAGNSNIGCWAFKLGCQ